MKSILTCFFIIAFTFHASSQKTKKPTFSRIDSPLKIREIAYSDFHPLAEKMEGDSVWTIYDAQGLARLLDTTCKQYNHRIELKERIVTIMLKMIQHPPEFGWSRKEQARYDKLILDLGKALGEEKRYLNTIYR